MSIQRHSQFPSLCYLLSLADSFCCLIQIKVLLFWILVTAWVILFFQTPIFGVLSQNQMTTHLSPKAKLVAPGSDFSAIWTSRGKPAFWFLVGVPLWGPKKGETGGSIAHRVRVIQWHPSPPWFVLGEHLVWVLNMLSIHVCQLVTSFV